MNKKTKTTVQPLSENTRRAIIITAIIVVAIIILSVSLALILKPAKVTPADNDPSSTGSSSLTIRNGDFYYTGSDDTAYPKTAQNWSRYGYKAVAGSSHDFESISTNDKAVMGIVTTNTDADKGDTWSTVSEDLRVEGITATNPGKHGRDGDIEEPDDDNVYMIATKEATAVSILSDSFSVSSGKSVKITVWINNSQLTGDAVVMLQKSTVSAKSENWYAYNARVEKADAWQKLEFYVFNRESSTKYIRLSVGVGNVYSGEENDRDKFELVDDQPITAEGVLFVDDITYEEVTANDYRTVVDDPAAKDSTLYKIIENEDIEDETQYLTWETLGGSSTTYTTAEQVAAEMKYSPFTDRDDFYKTVKNDTDESDSGESEETPPTEREPSGFTMYGINHKGGKPDGVIGFRLDASSLNGDDNKNINTLYSLWKKDHHHISFWVRVKQEDNKVAKANIYVQSYNTDTGEYEDVDNSKWVSQVGSQEIETDSNCGWVKYDIYLKPATTEKQISILVTLGSKDGKYSESDVENGLFPEGTLYVTSPAYEKLSSKDYNNASGGTYSKKIDLIGVSATTSVTNGSFSDLNNTGTQPSGWSPAFAGDNMLYRDGRGDDKIDGLDRVYSAVKDSSVVRNFEQTYGWDDEQQNVLLVRNSTATSFGYFSDEITLSAHTVYVLSALIKNDGGQPHFYLLNTDASLERNDRVIAEGITGITAANESALNYGKTSDDLENSWARYYIIVVTGDESQTVRLALFNGKIDGSELTTGSVYFDQIGMKSVGTYSMTTDEADEDAEKYTVTWNLGGDSYILNGEELSIKDLLKKDQIDMLVEVGALELEADETTKDGALSNLTTLQPDKSAWNTMLKIPEDTEDETTNETEVEPEETKTPVDWGLLFSVISSVALVAALLVVLVVKLFKNRKNQKRAA